MPPDRGRFVDGGVYRFEEIAAYVWSPGGPSAPDSLWEYRLADRGFVSAAPSDPLVDASDAARAVAVLRQAGLSLREIGRRAGVAFDSVQRAESARRVRQSTAVALLALAENVVPAATPRVRPHRT